MLDCFACASEYQNGSPILRVKQIIEYIEYNFNSRNVTAWGDFFVENITDIEAPLKIIHPKNFEMSDVSLDWFKDELQTKIIQELYGAYKLSIHPSDRSIYLSDPQRKQKVSYYVLESDVKRVTPPTEDVHELPFTMYETTTIPSYTKQVIRIQACKIKNNPYEANDNTNSFHIYGGQRLLEQLQENLKYTSYDFDLEYLTIFESLLKQFQQEYIVPSRHDVITWEATGKHKLNTDAKTNDLFLGCTNKPFEKKLITWYWSESSLFFINSKRNGLNLEVLIK